MAQVIAMDIEDEDPKLELDKNKKLKKLVNKLREERIEL